MWNIIKGSAGHGIKTNKFLKTRNHAFAKLIAQIIQLRANFPKNRIKAIRMDNAGEFT
jgi:hypothetical protein